MKKLIEKRIAGTNSVVHTLEHLALLFTEANPKLRRDFMPVGHFFRGQNLHVFASSCLFNFDHGIDP